MPLRRAPTHLSLSPRRAKGHPARHRSKLARARRLEANKTCISLLTPSVTLAHTASHDVDKAPGGGGGGGPRGGADVLRALRHVLREALPRPEAQVLKADGACNAPQAMAHFRDHGLREGRLFGCDGEANGTAPALESSCGRDKKYDDSFRVAVCFWGVHLCARLSCHVRSLNLISAQA